LIDLETVPVAGEQALVKERIEKMNGVNATGNSDIQQASAGSSSVFSQKVGQEEFLKLFITQLKHQDPMSPVSNEQFIAQLATFSSLEQLISINQAVTRLAEGT
jgi:flagellar basal-body rod modification protein FlgD